MYASLMADMIGVDLLPDAEVELAARHRFAGIDLRLTRRLGWLEQYGVTVLPTTWRPTACGRATARC